MSNLRNVAVFLGGMSPEHDISVLSGQEVFRHLDRSRWNPCIVHISRTGEWTFRDTANGTGTTLEFAAAIGELQRRQPHVVFSVLHGAYGEDGRFQGLMDYLGIRYVGSGCMASALALNKARARDVLTAAGLRVAPGQELRRPEDCRIEAPCVIKPMHLGSSVGLAVVHTEAERNTALEHAFQHDTRVLVEKFIPGREFTAGILEHPDTGLVQLPIVEIRPKTATYFDYHAKYTPGATDEICPADIPLTLSDTLQSLGARAHIALGCRHMSRTDVIVTEDGIPYVLETNTLPGMTSTSLLPQAAEAYGLSFTELLTFLLNAASDSLTA